MKKHLFCALLLAMSFAAAAQTDTSVKMVVSGAISSLGSVELTTGTSLSFSGDWLVVTQGDATQEFKLSDIDNIAFSAQMSAAEDIAADLESLKVDLRGGVVTVTVAPGQPVAYRVYSVKGALVMAGAGEGQVSFDVNPLSKGVYIIKINDKVIKFNR